MKCEARSPLGTRFLNNFYLAEIQFGMDEEFITLIEFRYLERCADSLSECPDSGRQIFSKCCCQATVLHQNNGSSGVGCGHEIGASKEELIQTDISLLKGYKVI